MDWKKPERLVVKKEWRQLFSREALIQGNALAEKRNGIQRKRSWYGGSETFEVRDDRNWYKVQISGEPRRLQDTWEGAGFSCTCGESRCRHMAAAMFEWEKHHGPWKIREGEYDYRARVEQTKRQAVAEARRRDAEKIGLTPVPAMHAFLRRKKDVPLFFDIERALSGKI